MERLKDFGPNSLIIEFIPFLGLFKGIISL
jgi:hypothetical protein